MGLLICLQWDPQIRLHLICPMDCRMVRGPIHHTGCSIHKQINSGSFDWYSASGRRRGSPDVLSCSVDTAPGVETPRATRTKRSRASPRKKAPLSASFFTDRTYVLSLGQADDGHAEYSRR